jgi:GMC oxidoreductase
MTTTLLKPTSRGRVALRSARPDAKPRISHNYLATERDRATLIASARLAMDIFRWPVVSKVQRALVCSCIRRGGGHRCIYPSGRQVPTVTQSGTCAMAGVIHSDLRFFGTEGLRVADASVMPSIVRGNTNAPVTAIAEKAAHSAREGDLPWLSDPGSDQSLQGEIGRIGKSANHADPDLGSKSDRQNQIGLQSTRGWRTVRVSTGESALWAHDGQSPIAHINRS